MKYKKILTQTIVLLGLFALAFSFNGNMTRENYKTGAANLLSNDSIPADTTYSDNPQEQIEDYVKDLSNSFNERGFYKSNSINGNGDEIINDFNGNLCYQIPLNSYKGRGDISYNLSLNYNGNVNYQIITGSLSNPRIYNFSAPGWIFSLNGFAVQMINFETNLLTVPNSGTNAIGNGIHLLPSGYNITKPLNSSVESRFDKITIMLGDGSSETLQNKTISRDTGDYYSTSKNSFLKARVDYYTTSPEKYRIMHLMKGDGLTYIFIEHRFNYYGIEYQNTPNIPNTFMLHSIKDRFGHKDTLTYNPSTSTKPGRPWLNSCPVANFEYPCDGGTYDNILISANGEPRYSIYTEYFDVDNGGAHRPQPINIRNSQGEIMKFSYSPYYRTGTGLYSNISLTTNMSIEFTSWPLHRLSEVTNYDGGIKKYYYIGLNLYLNYIPIPTEDGVHSELEYYKGQGRDLFFSNMLDSVVDYEDNIRNKRTSFSYHYSWGNRIPNTEYPWEDPINPYDDYSTIKTIDSCDNHFINSTPNYFQSIKYYRNYKTDRYDANNRSYYSGTLKLVKEEFYEAGGASESKTIDYLYCLGSVNSAINVYNGSFFDSVRTEIFNGVNNSSVERKWLYDYSGGYDGQHPLTMKKETDPLGRTTTTYFKNFERNRMIVFSDGKYRYSGSVLDTVNFYLIHMPDSIILSTSNSRLQKKEITYYNPETIIGQIISGYPGQISEDREVNPTTNDLIRKTSYSYYNLDTTGIHLYSVYNNFVNPNEGNIKSKTDPNGYMTKYYYDIISGNEKEQTQGDNEGGGGTSGRLSYHVLYNNGGDYTRTEPWADPRFPSRVDGYVTGERYLSNYQMFNDVGNPVKTVNVNKYYSQVDYDNSFRLKCLTLPYDFCDEEPEITYDTIVSLVPIEFTSTSTGYGYLEEFQHEFRFVSDVPIGTGLKYDLVLDNNLPDNISGTKQNDLIKFNKYDIGRTLYGIDSAFFVFYPPYVISKLNNTPVDYNLIIYALDTLYTEIVSGGYGSTYYSPGFGATFCGNLNHRDSTNCWGGTDPNTILYQYLSYKRRLNITNMLRSNLDTNVHGVVLEGLKLSVSWPANLQGNLSVEIPRMSGALNCMDYDFEDKWKRNLRPYLHIYGYKYAYDIRKHIKYKNGTLIYEYDDKENTTTINSKIDNSEANSRFKTTDYYFDGFGRLKQTKIHLPNDSAIYKTDYNYLGQKAKLTDANENVTKYSYDKYGVQSKTENADNSQNIVSNTFQSNLSTAFYTISGGFVNKQVYTDETGRKFDKYFDAVGNLLREIKYVDENSTPDGPPDFDSSTYIGDSNGEVTLITDYRYDDLYRVVDVRTPQANRISYTYDALGRQSSRTTPDAGLTKYIYDKNNNLLFSQDANQRTRGSNIYTFRNYDGLNRLLSIGETQIGTPNPDFGLLDTTQTDFIGNSSEMLTVNVYDSLVYAQPNVFSNIPTDYIISGQKNNTKGALVATAYKTNIADSWSYKFYRYDARGRVIKMWHYINGLGWKTMVYNYNSQNQVTYLNYQPSVSENKLYRYSYDSVSRLTDVGIYSEIASEESEEDFIGTFTSFASYTYNRNSQTSHSIFNNYSSDFVFGYNNRNWVSSFGSSTNPVKFAYFLTYLSNGNIRQAVYTGDYKSQLTNNSELRYNYIYDKSNRLNKADYFFGSSTNTFDAIMSYDYDGNLLTLKRYGSNENMIDNLTYSYYVNSNKINKVGGQNIQYTYDSVGNMTSDSRDLDNQRQNLKYDYRNLLIEMRQVIKQENGDGYTNYQLKYDYDEAGNRVRKRQYQYFGEETQPEFNEDSSPDQGPGVGGYWSLINDECYVRDVSGKEIAVYNSSNLDHWNVWGTDNVGKINANGSKFFYIKDHLGSVRIVLNSDNQIVSAIDYDCWGYPLENRSYQSDDINYKFTGKQRDAETGYDYFGARYYDARIGRWGGVEPLLEKYISYSPYQYGLLNPIKLVDANGKDVIVTIDGNNIKYSVVFNYTTFGGYGLKGESLEQFKNYVSEAQKNFNNAAKVFNKFSNAYHVEFEFMIKPPQNGALDMDQIRNNGENVAYYSAAKGEAPGVWKGNAFRIVDMQYTIDDIKYKILTPGNTGSHELGHAMGAVHVGTDNSDIRYQTNDYMGYNMDGRNPPSANDVLKMLQHLDLNNPYQIVRGDGAPAELAK